MLLLDLNPGARKAITTLAALHGLGLFLLGGFFSAFWIVNHYLAVTLYPLADEWDKSSVRALYVLQSIATVFSIGAFFASLMLFSLVANLLRLRGDTLATAILHDRNMTPKRVLHLFFELKTSIRYAHASFSRFAMPTIVVLVFSIAFQGAGYFYQRRSKMPKKFNGSYYLMPPAMVIVFLVVVASTVTAKTERIRRAVTSLFTVNTGADSQVVVLSSCIEASDTAFKLFGLNMTPQLANSILFIVFAAAGIAAWETLY